MMNCLRGKSAEGNKLKGGDGEEELIAKEILHFSREQRPSFQVFIYQTLQSYANYSTLVVFLITLCLLRFLRSNKFVPIPKFISSSILGYNSHCRVTLASADDRVSRLKAASSLPIPSSTEERA